MFACYEFTIALSMPFLNIILIPLNSATRMCHTDSAVSIDGHTLIRRDRCRGGGGVAMYVCNVIDFKIRSDLSDPDLEFCALKSKNPEPSHFLFQTV